MELSIKGKTDILRLRFNLDKRDIDDGLAVVAFAPFNAGKTFLMADFLKTQQAEGEVMFIDIIGERGSLSAANFGLGDTGYHVETYNEFIDLIKWARTRNIMGIGLDSLQTWLPLVCVHLFGNPRLPEEPQEWNKMHLAMKQSMDLLKTGSPWIFCICSAAIEVDPDEKVKTGQTKQFIAPDLPGKQARVIIGNFDLAGYLQVTKVGNKTSRNFIVDSPGKLLVRQRLPNPITEPILLPHGPGGWSAIRGAIEEALKPPGTDTKKGEAGVQ